MWIVAEWRLASISFLPAFLRNVDLFCLCQAGHSEYSTAFSEKIDELERIYQLNKKDFAILLLEMEAGV